MASLCKTLELNRPIREVELVYSGADRIDPSELEQVRQDAIVEGKRQAEEVHNAQILEFREELRTLHDEILGSIQEEFNQLKISVSEAMPRLAVYLLKKTLPTVEIDAGAIQKNVVDLVAQYGGSEEEGLTAQVSNEDFKLVCKSSGAAKDAEFIQEGNVRIVPSDILSKGDCHLKTKFGLIDASLQTKVKHIELTLLGE